MFSFFEVLVRLIGTLIHYVVTIIQSLVQLLNHAADGLKFLTTSIAYLPPFCRGALYCIVGISIVTMILKVGD